MIVRVPRTLGDPESEVRLTLKPTSHPNSFEVYDDRRYLGTALHRSDGKWQISPSPCHLLPSRMSALRALLADAEPKKVPA